VAITPPSDIVLDVALAADPARHRAAAERLARLRSTPHSAETSAAPVVRNLNPVTERPANAVDAVTTTNLAPRPGSAGQARRRLDAYGQFEAFVLQSFIESMLPRNAINVFGRGSAGEFWRSMLAEKMSGELARSGSVGIASRLAAGATHPVHPIASTTAGPLTPPVSLLSMLPYIEQQPADTAPSTDLAASANTPIPERS
jgi:peptidoglycan hydrolase FlgJ